MVSLIMEKDIALAIQKERQYYTDKQSMHSNTLHIMDYIGQAGYTNYKTYYSDLQEYLLKTQSYEVVEEPEINANIPIPYLTEHRPAFLYTINCPVNYAFVPNGINDYTQIEECGYTPVKLGYDSSNGPILSADGDLRIYLIYYENIDIDYVYFGNKLVQFLSNYFDDVVLDKNDVMIDGKKVIGGASTKYNGMKIVVFQINFVDKLEDILRICGTPNKLPGFIDTSVVNAEQIKNEFLLWLRL